MRERAFKAGSIVRATHKQCFQAVRTLAPRRGALLCLACAAGRRRMADRRVTRRKYGIFLVESVRNLFKEGCPQVTARRGCGKMVHTRMSHPVAVSTTNMETPRPDDVVNSYLDGIAAGDFARVRSCLADSGFSNRSPISTFDNPDAFVADISRVGAILERIERRRIFVEGTDVCVILDYVTHMHKRQVTPVVHWFRVVNGKITSIETFFDARVYEELFQLVPDVGL